MTRRSNWVLTVLGSTALLLGATACSSTTTGTAPATTGPFAAVSGSTSSNASQPPGTIPATIPTRSAGCTSPPVAQDLTTGAHVDLTMTSSGVTRSYKQYVPAAYRSAPTPLIVDLHGYSEGNVIHTAMSNLAATADKDGFLLVTPLGNGKIAYWNAVPNPTGPDDVRFVSDLIDQVSTNLCVDPARVYVVGLSNGAFLSSLVACNLADKVAAIAPVAGLRWPDNCSPSRPIPIVAFHGTVDPLVRYDGSPSDAAGKLPSDDESRKNLFEGLTFAPMPDNLAKWATNEGCDAIPSTDPVTEHVKLIRYTGCRRDSVVEMYVVDGGGHSWPGSRFSAAAESILGPTTFEVDANELMWKFFQEHPLTIS